MLSEMSEGVSLTISEVNCSRPSIAASLTLSDKNRKCIRFTSEKPIFSCLHVLKPDFHSLISSIVDAAFLQRKISPSKINLHFQWSEELLQMKTNLKPDNCCFENNTDVCFLLGPIKLWGGHFVKSFWLLWKFHMT